MVKRVSLPKEIKRRLLEKQNMLCPCGRKITLTAMRLRDWKKQLGRYPDKTVPSQAKFHHKIPLYAGGSNHWQNFVGLCGQCHRKAHYNLMKYKLKVI